VTLSISVPQAAGTAQPSLTSHLLEQYDGACDSERSQEVIKDVAGIVFAGKIGL